MYLKWIAEWIHYIGRLRNWTYLCRLSACTQSLWHFDSN